MVKTRELLLVIAISAISCCAFPTTVEHPQPVEAQANSAADSYITALSDPINSSRMRKEVTVGGELALTIANTKENITTASKEHTPEDLSPTKVGSLEDLSPPTKDGEAEESLTDEELSELARCGFRGYGGGFNRPIFLPSPINPSFVDVNLASRLNNNNINNRPAIDLLSLLWLLG